jgi:hypothetical protein
MLLPAALGGLLLFVGRRRLLQNMAVRRWLATIILIGIAGVLTACGSGNGPKTDTATPGTSTIQIMGTGTPADGASSLSQSVGLSLTVQ